MSAPLKTLHLDKKGKSSERTKQELCPPHWGGGHIIFAFSAVRRHTVLILSLPNLACWFIGLIACMGLLLVMIAL